MMNDFEKVARKIKKFLNKKAIPEIEQFLDEYGDELFDGIVAAVKDYMASGGDVSELRKSLNRFVREFIKEHIK